MKMTLSNLLALTFNYFIRYIGSCRLDACRTTAHSESESTLQATALSSHRSRHLNRNRDISATSLEVLIFLLKQAGIAHHHLLLGSS